MQVKSSCSTSFLPVVATCWFGGTTRRLQRPLQSNNFMIERRTLLCYEKEMSPYQKEASIFDGMCGACSVVGALTAVVWQVRGHSAGFRVTVRRGSPSMKHSCMSGWCKFYSYWKNSVSGAQSAVTWKRILLSLPCSVFYEATDAF